MGLTTSSRDTHSLTATETMSAVGASSAAHQALGPSQLQLPSSSLTSSHIELEFPVSKELRDKLQPLLTTKKALEKLQVDLQNNVADLGAKAELDDSVKSKKFDAKSH